MDPDPYQPRERLSDPVMLHFETSPYGTVDAIVQHDGRSVYFYLNETPANEGTASRTGFGTRACWVQNLEVGPLVIDDDEMKQGISPMLPRTHCVHREAQPVPAADNLKIVWFEEGNGAALIESAADGTNEILAVIPPWSGLEGFHGYASQCAIESPLCWPLPDNPRLAKRIESSRQFWNQWAMPPATADETSIKNPNDPFSNLQPQILEAYRDRFLLSPSNSTVAPIEPNYFSIDGGTFPPRGLALYQFPHESILATVGMSVCPQPAVELFTDQPMHYRRIELAVRLKQEPDQDAGEFKAVVDSVASQLSGLAAYPWTHFTWFGPGHTCGLTGASRDSSTALLVHDRQLESSPMKQLELPPFRGDPINLLWLLPITATQQSQLENQSTTVDEILAIHNAL